MKLDDRIELEIESLAAGGDGVARYEGRVVFVPYAAPGDRALCVVRELRSRFARASIEQLREPGPARRDPGCPNFENCGGCSWLHLEESVQSEARAGVLRDALGRIGQLKQLPPFEWLESPRSLGYRSRARVAYEPGIVGFRAGGSHRVVDVAECAVLDSETQAELERLRCDPPEGRGEVELRGFEEDAAGLQVSSRSFFQANRSLWDAWPQVVATACGRGETCVELHAGVGFYTVHLAKRFENVIAVERSAAALDLAQNSRAQVHRMSAERFALTELPRMKPDCILINPPRIGCDKVVIDALRDAKPARVVYVSCAPATLARDLKHFDLEANGYVLQRVVGIDALPQTHHVEAIAVLETDSG